MKKSKKKKSYDYTDPCKYGHDNSMEGCHFSELPDYEDEEEYLDDDGYYDFVPRPNGSIDSMNEGGSYNDYEEIPLPEEPPTDRYSGCIQAVHPGDVVKIMYVNGNFSVYIFGFVLKVYDNNRLYVHVLNSNLFNDMYDYDLRLKSWKKYDTVKTGFYVDLTSEYNHCANYEVVERVKYKQYRVRTMKTDIDSGKSQESDHIYNVYTNSTGAVLAEYKGFYGFIDQIDKFPYDEDKRRRLACFRANVKHRINVANNLGIGNNLT